MKYFVILIFICSNLFAQEVESPLSSVTRTNLHDFKKIKNSLSLPFFDDFSSIQKSSTNWIGKSTLINNNYPINPPTIGVVTFDGLDSNGFAYDINMSNNSDLADVLLSQEVNLGNTDTAFLLFYYQPQGYGDNPQFEDSLVLEFLSDSSGVKSWNNIWSVSGSSVHEFKKEVIMINDPYYLHNSFQFRFKNYATLSGNFDHWHIDYIKLDNFSISNDTSNINDVSFVYDSPSFLKRYNEMPWTHFKDNMNDEINDTINILLRNNQASINVDYQYNVYDDGSIIDHYPSLGISRNITVLDYDSIGNYSFENPPISIKNNVFPYNNKDSCSFLIEHIIGTGSNDYKVNDTLVREQKFYSHFSYDDGSVESAYGINVSGAMAAYQFKLNRPDTLRAVQMYFPQMLDSVNQLSFLLTVWDDNNGVPGNILYQKTEYPKHTSSNLFHFYYLDSLFQLTDVFYVGWQQNTSDLLNIGLDKNNSANQYMFYNVGGIWNNSQYSGSWMIRPIVSMNDVFLSAVNVEVKFDVFPNPTSNEVTIETSSIKNKLILYDISGKLILVENFNSNKTRINLSNFKNGTYILELRNNNGNFYKKLIVN